VMLDNLKKEQKQVQYRNDVLRKDLLTDYD
jgi:hypothetical protein